MDVEAERAAARRTAMDSVLSQLSTAQGTTDTTDICMAIYRLGNAASPEARMSEFLPFTTRFEEACKLGEGNYGVVVKARNHVTGETVALKTFRAQPLYHADYSKEDGEEKGKEEKDVELSRRVLREACFMAACRGHPSIVRLSAVGHRPDTAQHCLIMEHVGPSLHDVLVDQRKCKPFRERDVRRMMRQVLSGAAAMHERGVVHRAINPNNIFVGDGDVLKIGDYGEATSVSETGVPCVSIIMSYLAPEALLGALGAGSCELVDSWSMGCLMLELLTGENHFEAMVEDDYEGQLYKIFDVLGLPGKRTMKAIKPGHLHLAKEVQKWRARQRRVGKQQSSRLGELVPFEVLSDDGFEVLQGLLTCNPKKRLTAAGALQLPWFTDNDSPAAAVPQVAAPEMGPCPFQMAFAHLRSLVP